MLRTIFRYKHLLIYPTFASAEALREGGLKLIKTPIYTDKANKKGFLAGSPWLINIMGCQSPAGLPTLIIAHLKPMSSLELSWSRNLLVEGLSQ